MNTIEHDLDYYFRDNQDVLKKQIRNLNSEVSKLREDLYALEIERLKTVAKNKPYDRKLNTMMKALFNRHCNKRY